MSALFVNCIFSNPQMLAIKSIVRPGFSGFGYSTTSVLLCFLVILLFATQAAEDIYNGKNTSVARRLLPRDLWNVAFRKLDQIDVSVSLDDLRVPPGNRLESLKADRSGQYSIRINDQYRICFVWNETDASEVEIVDYH